MSNVCFYEIAGHKDCMLSSRVEKKIKMSARVGAGSNIPQNQDPRRDNRIYRYTPLTNKPSQDPLPDYISLLGMVFSMLGLMMRMKWAAWAAVYCSFISFANSKASEDTKQMFSSFLLSVSAVVMSYLQNPQPMTAPW